MAKYYVKSTIASGSGSGDTLTVSERVKAARVTEYSKGGIAFPRSAAKYSHATQAGIALSLDYCYIGSDTKTMEIDFMELLIVGYLDAGASAVHYSFMFEIVRCNFTSAIDIGTGSYAYSPIVPFDSDDAASTMAVKFTPTGITNEEVLFRGYFHVSQFTVNPLLYQNKMSIAFGRENGKPILLSGSTQTIVPRVTPIASADRLYLLGSIQTNWYEY